MMGKGDATRTGGGARGAVLTGLLLLAFALCEQPAAADQPPSDAGAAPGAAPPQRPREPLLVPPEGAPEPLNPPPAAGPAMDEVLDLIRQQGSVLEGSVLDELAGSRETVSAPDRARRLRLAESLLRSARLLEQIDAESPERRELCRYMRREALRVLREALEPSSSLPRTPSSDGSIRPGASSP